MKTNYRIVLLMLAAVTAFSGCDSEEIDTAKPQILLIEPAEEEAYAPGSAIHFMVTLSDNEALASYKVNIHGAFDGHDHSASSPLRTGKAITRATEDSMALEITWLESDFIKLGEEPIAGKRSVTIQHHLMQVPDSVNGRPVKEGHYHFTVYCTDSSGQESFIAREIVIAYDAEEHKH